MTTPPAGPQQPHPGSDPNAMNPLQPGWPGGAPGPASPSGSSEPGPGTLPDHVPPAPPPPAGPHTQPWFGPQSLASASVADEARSLSSAVDPDAHLEPFDEVPPRMLASASDFEAPHGLASASAPETDGPALTTSIPASVLSGAEPDDEAGMRTHLAPAPPQPGPFIEDAPATAAPRPPAVDGASRQPGGQAPDRQPSVDHATHPIGAIPGWQPVPPPSAPATPTIGMPPVGQWQGTPPAGATPVFAPPAPRRERPRPSLAALAIPLALALGVASFAGGWFAGAAGQAKPAATVTITAAPSPASSGTPLPPPPTGLTKPVGSINLANAVGEHAKTKANSSGDLVQAAVYAKQAAPINTARVVNVMRNANVARLSAGGAAVKDFETYRCWREFGLHLCAANVDGGAIVTTAPEGFTTQADTAAFFAALLKTA